MKNKSQYIQISTTVANRNNAEKIAKILLNKNIAACVQIVGPIKSIYRWKEKLEKSTEWICLVKTQKSLYKKVEKTIKKVHSYELPEIIATSINKGSQEYFEWIKRET